MKTVKLHSLYEIEPIVSKCSKGEEKQNFEELAFGIFSRMTDVNQ